jgi:uncharacterized repeat protein (TIGR03803 family)
MVYKVDPNGVETILYSFSGSPDGSGPTGGLAIDPEGNVYGTTQIGGLMGYGTIFKVDPSGNETVLHNFSRTDGEDPLGSVILDGQGNLYGTTSAGGAHFSGTLFKLDASGNLTTLHDFAEFPGDGSVPFSGVVAESSGNLFGTTSTGTGPYFGGTVYKVDINGRVTILHSFTGGTDGGFPNADVVRDAAGNLYGTTVYSGDPNCRCGVVFKITP